LRLACGHGVEGSSWVVIYGLGGYLHLERRCGEHDKTDTNGYLCSDVFVLVAVTSGNFGSGGYFQVFGYIKSARCPTNRVDR